MNPFPLTSTTAHTWPRESAAATSSAMSRGGRPTCLARARAPLAWKSARSEGRRVGSAPGTTVSKASWSLSRRTRATSGIPHCRMAARTVRRRDHRSVGGRSHGTVHEPVAAVRAEEPVLEEAVADVAVVGVLGNVVDDAVLGQALDLLDVEYEALGHRLGAVVHPVAPVGVDAVAGPDGDVVGQQRAALHLDAGLGKAHDRVVDDAGAGNQMVLVLGRPEIVDAPGRIAPHPLGLDERTLAVVALVADVHEGVVLELHREVRPHAGEDQLALADAVGLGLADGAHTPRAVPGTPAALGRDGQIVAPDREAARPGPGL